TVDEPVRHAISKLSHIHLVTSEDAASRLIRMGEMADNVHVVGAPGLDGLESLVTICREALCAGVGFDPKQPIALMVYHPVLQEADRSARRTDEIISALLANRTQVLALKPNSDAGSNDVRVVLERFAGEMKINLVTHLSRSEFVSWMAAADLM